MEGKRIGLGLDPMPEDSPHPAIKIIQAWRAQEVQGKGPGKIHGVIQGEEERDQVGDVIGVKVANTAIIDLAVVKAQPGHLPQASPSSVKEDQVGPEGKGQARRTAVHRGDASARA